MGRKSTKENKNIYQVSREAMEYSRETCTKAWLYLLRSD